MKIPAWVFNRAEFIFNVEVRYDITYWGIGIEGYYIRGIAAGLEVRLGPFAVLLISGES